MWGKFSFRLKITVIFLICLTILTVSLTALSMMNARQNLSNPLELGFRGWVNLEEPSMIIRDGIEETVDFPFDEHIMVMEETDVVRLMVDQFHEQLFAAQRDFRNQSILIAVAVILLGTLGAYWVAGVIVRPIKTLSTSIGKIEADQLGVSLPSPKSRDEISQLTASFNGMLGKLHRSFESKQLFAQNASHELKTPLALIRTEMEVFELSENPTIKDYEELFVEVKNNNERMIDLVEDMLTMGKTLTEADMMIFEARDIFKDIFTNLNDQILSKCLEIEIKGKLKLKGKKTLLTQAFNNLISNAVRYNKEGGSIVVTMSANQITIEDTGIGIPSEAIDQLFDPFYRVDNSRSKKLGGNGLGLAITKNILGHHQMRIDIHSETGRGTTITIKI